MRLRVPRKIIEAFHTIATTAKSKHGSGQSFECVAHGLNIGLGLCAGWNGNEDVFHAGCLSGGGDTGMGRLIGSGLTIWSSVDNGAKAHRGGRLHLLGIELTDYRKL